jgi:OmpA-OmpF porin, OOP family
MRVHQRLGRRVLLPAMVLMAGLGASRRASADVITIDDGAKPGPTTIPFTCSVDTSDTLLWLPTMGFVYRNVQPFELIPGDTIAFDIDMPAGGPADLGFFPQLDIALAHASDPLDPFAPDDLPGGSDFTLVADDAIAASMGNRNQSGPDYDLVFTVQRPFKFPGGGLIIRVSDPKGVLATKDADACQIAITSDTEPSGTNRLVGTFRREVGEYPWLRGERIGAGANVPYVQIRWTRCGDGDVRQDVEECDDGNLDNTDDCTSACLNAFCGDGFVHANINVEECDNSANPDNPDPFCDSECHMGAIAKGSGCDAGGGGGVAALVILGFGAFGVLGLRRRRTAGAAVLLVALAWAGPARAQMKTDGFRVDRFEMAPTVEDGLVIQDPGVLRHMGWSINATLGFTNTILRVVPESQDSPSVDVVGPRLSAYLDFALGIGDRVEVNVSFPFALAQATESGVAAGFMLNEASATTAISDGRLGGSVLVYGRKTGPRIGLGGTLILPLGSEDSFTGDGGVGAEAVVTAGYVRPGYRVIVNGGMRFRPEADYVTSDQGTEIIGRAGVIVPFANNRLNTSLELDLQARTSDSKPYRELGLPLLALLGARYHFEGGFRAGAGVGMGLTEAPGSPAVRALLTVGYSPEPKPPRPPRPEPILDFDKDRIVDNLDRCPKDPEDYDGIDDGDGCPDRDSDTDKVVDTEPEPVPQKPLTLEDVVTLPAPIEFYFDTAIMRPGAEVYLVQVLEVLQRHPEVLKMECQGHTSSEGGPEYNMRLSNDRAKAVVAWLVDHGIESSRLLPKGYGLTQPLAPNDNEPNRQKNRRVQFRILEQTPGSRPIGPSPNYVPPPAATPAPAAAPRTTPAPAAAPRTTPAPATPAPAAAPRTTPAPASAAPAAAPRTTPAPAPAPAAAPRTTPAPAPAPAAAPRPAPAPAPAAAPRTTPAPAPAPAAAPRTTPAPAPTPAPPAAPPAKQ